MGEIDVWWSLGRPRPIRAPEVPGDRAQTQTFEMTVTAVRADGQGGKLVATVRGRRAVAVPSLGFIDVQTIAVTPAAVRALVESAAPAGVWPDRGTHRTEIELPQRALPEDLEFRPEHLTGLPLIWTRERGPT
jgi:hypothetical protein